MGKVAERHQKKTLRQHRSTEFWICDTIGELQSTSRNLLYLLHVESGVKTPQINHNPSPICSGSHLTCLSVILTLAVSRCFLVAALLLPV
jgi:hypothetical protein